MVYHGAGWLEGEPIASYEKFIIDCEMIQQLQRYLDSDITGTSEEQLAISAIEEVGHNGHFFGASHNPREVSRCILCPLFIRLAQL